MTWMSCFGLDRGFLEGDVVLYAGEYSTEIWGGGAPVARRQNVALRRRDGEMLYEVSSFVLALLRDVG